MKSGCLRSVGRLFHIQGPAVLCTTYLEIFASSVVAVGTDELLQAQGVVLDDSRVRVKTETTSFDEQQKRASAISDIESSDFVQSTFRSSRSEVNWMLCADLCTNVWRLSMAASSICYSAFFGGSAMPAKHTRSKGFLCGWPVALELSTRLLERSGSWQGQLQKSAEDTFIYTVLKYLAY